MVQCTDMMDTESKRSQDIRILIFITFNTYNTRVYQFLYIVCIIHKNLYKNAGLFSLRWRSLFTQKYDDFFPCSAYDSGSVHEPSYILGGMCHP
jgi:hypothetical protein